MDPVAPDYAGAAVTGVVPALIGARGTGETVAWMPEPVAGITKAGNICANSTPRRRFLAKVLLNNVVGVDTILLA